MGGEEKKTGEIDEDRRTFLKVSVVASAALAVGGIAALAKTVNTPVQAQQTSSQTTFPRVQVKDITTGTLATVSSLVTNTPLSFFYPLDNQPNIIIKLGVAVEDGVGPASDIVAYSDLCQHLGCNPGFISAGESPACNSGYSAKGPEFYCCCHGSIYDLASDAKVIGGPAPRAVPRVILEVDASGNVFATGMTSPTIYGFGPAGSDDVSYDLQGGTPVS